MEHQEKLIPHFLPHYKYICLGSNLKYYVEKGLKVDKVHRILTFKQTAWLKSYVEFNSAKRLSAQTEFEKMFYKLCVNAVFGKGMESVRKRINVRVVNNQKSAERLIAKAQFLTHDILGSNLACFNMQKPVVSLNKAIYTGFAVLELSKLHMAKFHYDYVKEKWGKKAKLLMTDTDSFAYLILTRDVYEDIGEDLSLFDTSNLPSSHPLYSTKNRGVVGKMKDEAKGEILVKFTGIAPKSYCFLGESSQEQTFEKMAMKGIPKGVQKRSMCYSTVENILLHQNRIACTVRTMRSYKHTVYNIKSRKAALHAFDSKRYILQDGKSTLPYGHFIIRT